MRSPLFLLKSILRLDRQPLELVGLATTAAPGVSVDGEARVYYDSTTDELNVSRSGGAYKALAAQEDIVTLAVAELTLAALDTQYRVSFDFSAVGTFAAAGRWRVASVACDQVGAYIEENLTNRTTGTGELLVTVPTGAAAGSYGTNLNLSLTVTLAGYGWTGASTTGVATTWGSPT